MWLAMLQWASACMKLRSFLGCWSHAKQSENLFTVSICCVGQAKGLNCKREGPAFFLCARTYLSVRSLEPCSAILQSSLHKDPSSTSYRPALEVKTSAPVPSHSFAAFAACMHHLSESCSLLTLMLGDVPRHKIQHFANYVLHGQHWGEVLKALTERLQLCIVLMQCILLSFETICSWSLSSASCLVSNVVVLLLHSRSAGCRSSCAWNLTCMSNVRQQPWLEVACTSAG